jgi:predicted TIM-barrel fold metal-dependent hydrolase
LAEILAALGSDDLLLYGSDFPHQHAAPGTIRSLSGAHSAIEEALGLAMPARLVEKLMAGNAKAWYGDLAHAIPEPHG